MNSTIGSLGDLATRETTAVSRIGVTTGDPAGIGPEVCLKLLQHANSATPFHDILLFVLGDAAVLRRTAHRLGWTLDVPIIPVSDFPTLAYDSRSPCVVDFATPNIDTLEIGRHSPLAGQAAFSYLETAIRWHLQGQLDGITTGPINKMSLQMADYHFPGHTEILAAMTGVSEYCMMQYSEELTCSFVTTHVGYAEVPSLLTSQRIVDVIRLSWQTIRAIRKREPKLVVCGLNPHAGENGLFGNREEETIILPAVQQSQSMGIDVTGPLPPDTCFLPARRRETDGYICMYHDQGHIPLKALVFETAVNVTLGLPIVRTSVDHGTAFDIVGRNIADPSSMIEAAKLAGRLAELKSKRV